MKPTHEDIAECAFFLWLWKNEQGWPDTPYENWETAEYMLNNFPGWESA
jgi:hypothetical protein